MNTDPGGTVHGLGGRYVPSFFDAVHDRGGRTALYAGQGEVRAVRPVLGSAHGRRRHVSATTTGATRSTRSSSPRDVLVDRLVTSLRTRPGGELPAPRAPGHRGPRPRLHVAGVPRAPSSAPTACSAAILDTVAEDDPDLRDSIDVVLTADHGGRGRRPRRRHGRGQLHGPVPGLGCRRRPGPRALRAQPRAHQPGHAAGPATTTRRRSATPTWPDLVTSLLAAPEVAGSVPHTHAAAGLLSGVTRPRPRVAGA